ncbi:L,D-transpeptidase family protein [Alphaproteobacteria bacterium KMM 3653]|uniref:L,D-transpeptidase family protein n=2 Tax=Harenicola maris TaxID=2841044 RepID=A0AAP2CLY1_9RHOB|nr:L,D-transpeptidase family protein [Harenicola maris]
MVPQMAQAQTTGFKQALAAAVSDNKSVAAFYKANGYSPIFVGTKDRGRRSALLKALRTADVHGLPAARYRMQELEAAFKAARSPKDRGRVEGMAAKIFVQFARDLQSGALEPHRVDSGIVRVIPRRDAGAMLASYSGKSPAAFMKSLAPRTPEYARLMKEKMKLEKVVGQGGWGPKVQASAVKPGQSGGAVVELRNRLIAMGYLKRTSTPAYDGNMQKAVQLFQFDHGLVADGVAGETTIKEVNTTAQKRLSQVIVAMERERWMEGARGDRHVLVNIPDFSAKIMDNGKVTFQTRTVVGANTSDRRTPEFSDIMEHMVINPTWNVPRSIATKEYLPLFQKNRNAAGHLQLYDNRGRKVSRANINFASYNARTFPYAIKQPPSRRNALGLVKFMFPNKHNIYLHDTPAKNLFGRDVRAFSHGCVRLNDPFDFAYALLAKQQKDPVGFFQARLKTGNENVVPLQKQVPVHIIYRTAFTQPKGRINYRRDIYGRDAALWNALQKAGVTLRAAKG